MTIHLQCPVGSLHSHTHAPDSARCEIVTVGQNITKRAVETVEAPQQMILGREMQHLTQAAAVQIAIWTAAPRHVRRRIRRVRQEIRAPQPLPADRATVELPEEYKTLPNGCNFLLFDSGVGDDQ